MTENPYPAGGADFTSPPRTYGTQPPPGWTSRPEPKNGFAITALTLAIAGLVFGLIPIMGWAAFIAGAVGLLFGLLNIGRIRRGRSTARKMTWFGSIGSIVAMTFGVIGMVIYFQTIDDLDNDLRCIDEAETIKQMDRCGE